MKKFITRYAPSPTGNPHVGNIRTALFSYLYSKFQNGKFLLRIEDTDRARFIPDSIKYIEESLKWLGIDFDGEKIYQSERVKVYQEYASELESKGFAYKCFCTTARLDKLRSDQIKRKLPPAYDKHCQSLDKKEIEANLKAKKPYVIRFSIPQKGSAKWDDLIRGNVEINYNTQDDFVLVKSDGWPTYNFANVIDDHEMEITDVLRGEEFVPSTPKHIALYNAFNWNIPNFGHLPLILGPDKSKLSKRHGDTAILDYREKGYLPEAMVNFLSQLGWNDGTEKELYNLSELIKSFDVKKIQKSPAVFDIEKLNWFNGQYIRTSENRKLKDQIKTLYPKSPLLKLANFERILEVEKSRLTTLNDINQNTEYFLTLPKYNPKLLIFKNSNHQTTKAGLDAALHYFSLVEWGNMSVKDFENGLLRIVADNNLSNGDVFWPVRVALSGQEKSPSPAELLWALGKEESLKRLSFAIKKI